MLALAKVAIAPGILLLFQLITQCMGIDISILLDAGDSLIDIVLSDEFDNMFQSGKVKVDGLTLLKHIESNTKLEGEDFETLFHNMLGSKSKEGLAEKTYTWDQATDVINALIKLADNLSINESRKPNSKYQHEDARITEAKKEHDRKNANRAEPKVEL